MKSSHSLASKVRTLLGFFGLNIQRSPIPGISLFGFNLYKDSRPGPVKYRSHYAMNYVLNLPITTVLDIGSGAGHHAKVFSHFGLEVECVDFGTSVYAVDNKYEFLNVVHSAFEDYSPQKKFDLVWASHVLEHQRNVGAFLEKCIECCSDQGYIAITVPDQHRLLLGGHLTHWSPGLLIYNMVMSGLDLSQSFLIRGSNEWSVVCKKEVVELPSDLSYDFGDIDKLKSLMPPGFKEQCDLFLNPSMR